MEKSQRQPLVTVITPTYNHEKYIARCIGSVLHQTYTNWEQIIINDGSTDGTRRIIDEMGSLDARIKVIHQDNIGVFRLGETYNKALQMARGEFIAILEGDDGWYPEKLERQMEILINQPDINLAYGRAHVVNADESEIYYTGPKLLKGQLPVYSNEPVGSIIQINTMGDFLPALTLVFRKSALQQIGGFVQQKGLPMVDFPTILRMSLTGPFYFDPYVMGFWRIYATQTTKKHTVALNEGTLTFIREFLPDVKTLSESQKEILLKNFKANCLIAYSRSGRFKLIRREFNSARIDYWKAIRYPIWTRPLWKIRSLIGIVMSYFHTDVEWLARLMGKISYK